MQITLEQLLLLVITIAVVVAVTFFISLFVRLRKTAREGEETLAEMRTLIRTLDQAAQKALEKIEDVDETIRAAKKTAGQLSDITWFLTTKMIRPSSKYWPVLLPFLRIGWRQWKKRKEKYNVK